MVCLIEKPAFSIQDGLGLPGIKFKFFSTKVVVTLLFLKTFTACSKLLKILYHKTVPSESDITPCIKIDKPLDFGDIHYRIYTAKS